MARQDAPRPQPGIDQIALYVGGKAQIAGRDDVLKLSANENPFGPSPAAIEAYRAAAAALHRYPPTDHAALRAAIAGAHGLDADRVICGVGSDEVLSWVTQGYAGPGDEVVLTAHGFSLYPILARAAGACPVTVPEAERCVDVDAILAAITDRTRVVFLTNPGNPTGTILPVAEVTRLAEEIPRRVLLVIDGAYAEYVEQVGYDAGIALTGRLPNVLVTRTFSKIHGLGGLRIGWGYGPRAVIDTLNRLRQPFNLSPGQLAAAEAAIRDAGHVARCRAENARLREALRAELTALGLRVDASQTNFVLARFVSEAEAAAADAHLQGRGILVRRVTGYGFPEALRITVGRDEDCARVVEALRGFRAASAA